MSPSVSRQQQRFMGAELSRKRKGQSTRTGMTEAQLEEYASTQRSKLPVRAGMHKMPDGHMMPDKEMKPMMGAKGPHKAKGKK